MSAGRISNNKEFVSAVVDLLIERYGDALVFDVFLETWEPLESVREAIDYRIREKNKKRTRNKFRYKHRELILNVDDYTCYMCGKRYEPEQLEVDHILEVEFGGSDEFENVATACITCNRRKAKRTERPGSVNKEEIKKQQEAVKKRRTEFINSGVFNGATYGDFKEEVERDGKVRGKSRFERINPEGDVSS